MRMRLNLALYGMAAAAVAFAPTVAMSADKVRVILSTKLIFELHNAYNAKEQGFFAKEGLDVELIHGSGGAATLQTIVTGSQDIAVSVGVLSVISAYAKGNPVKILANSKRGIGEIYWYVPTASPIMSLKDLDGKQLAYSRDGSTTHLASLFLKKAAGIDAKLVSVGGPSSSRTQVMSGQVHTGWSLFPLNQGLLREGKIRVVARGSQATDLTDTTIRVIAANSKWLEKNRDVARRTMRALWKGVLFNYVATDTALKSYAKRWKLNLEDVKRAPDFVPLHKVSFAPIGRIDQLADLALEFKRIRKPLTAEQKKDMVDIIYDPAKAM